MTVETPFAFGISLEGKKNFLPRREVRRVFVIGIHH
jgi:hypothetical protein